MTAGAAAQAAEVRKHTANGQRCTNLGWSCIPLAVESYGAWGREAQMCFTLLATRLAVHNSSSKSKIGTSRFFSNRVLCCDFITLYKSTKNAAERHLMHHIGLVSQKLQRSKHCILSERYSMRDRRKNCDGLCSLYCSH